MAATTLPPLRAGGHPVPTDPESFGFLRDSRDALGDVEELRRRLNQDGYLYVPGFFDREAVREVRLSLCRRLAEDDLLDPAFPIEDAIAKEGVQVYFRPEIAMADQLLPRLIYGENVMGFYSNLFGEPAMHYDFTWLRVVAPGLGTWPHADVVYMGRGTHRLVTAWVPFGDIPLSVGGLIVLEGSHQDGQLDFYRSLDVDTACTNKENQSQPNANAFPGFGALSFDFEETRERYGRRRWLTAEEFRMGDLLTFRVDLVHGSLDNGSRQIRLSSDSRYQPASEPADERWMGENPPAHGGDSVRPLIC
jgi:hypothetical protein